MNQTTEIVKGALPPIEFNVTDQAIAELRKECQTFDQVPTDTESYKALSAQIGKVRALWVQVEGRRKELNAPLLDYKRNLDGEAKRIDGLLKELVEPLQGLKKEADAEKARIKAEKAALEQKRISAIEDRLFAINQIPVRAIGKSLDELGKIMAELQAIDPMDGTFNEFATRALQAKGLVIDALDLLISDKLAEQEREKARQAEQAAARKREEKAEARRKAEQEKRAKEAQERSEREAKEAQKLRKERKKLDEREANLKAETTRLREEKDKAEKKERNRKQRIQDEEVEKKRQRHAAEERRQEQEYREKLVVEFALLYNYVEKLMQVHVPEIELEETMDIFGPLSVAIKVAKISSGEFPTEGGSG